MRGLCHGAVCTNIVLLNEYGTRHYMRGLCHGCFTSNAEITVANGGILCADCTDTDRDSERG